MEHSTLPLVTQPPHGPAAARLARMVEAGLPPTLVRLWAASGRGVLVVAEGEAARYEPGPFWWRDAQGWGALWLPPDGAAEPLWETVGEWLDRFGGSFGGEALLGDGHGATPALADAASRLEAILALGYAKEALGIGEAAPLLARAIAWHRLRPATLRAADPPLAKWLRGALFDEGFWRKVQREIGN